MQPARPPETAALAEHANLPGPHGRPPAQIRADVCPEAASPHADNPGHGAVRGPRHASKLQSHRGPAAPAWGAPLRLSAPESREVHPPPRSQAPGGRAARPENKPQPPDPLQPRSASPPRFPVVPAPLAAFKFVSKRCFFQHGFSSLLNLPLLECGPP